MKSFLVFLAICFLFFIGIAIGLMIVFGFFSSSSSIILPKIEGLSVEEGENILKQNKLKLKVLEERYDLKMDKGEIITQSPSEGSIVKKGQIVFVTVSKGIDKVIIPDLNGKTLSSSQLELSKIGLKVKGVSYIFYTSPPDTIITHFPPPDTIVPKESGCYLLISKGPLRPTFVMPNLMGKKIDTIVKSLSQYGFKVLPNGDSNDVVKSQSPPMGTPVDSTKTLFVGAQ